jgi:hypothetical protein
VIEFFSDGEYVVSVRQEKGWPRQLPQPGGRRPVRSQRAAITWSQGAWVTLHGASSGSTFRVPPASRDLKVSARK